MIRSAISTEGDSRLAAPARRVERATGRANGHGHINTPAAGADRRGLDDPLLAPEAAIDPSEDAVSMTRPSPCGRRSRRIPAVHSLLDALVALLTGGGRKH